MPCYCFLDLNMANFAKRRMRTGSSELLGSGRSNAMYNLKKKHRHYKFGPILLRPVSKYDRTL